MWLQNGDNMVHDSYVADLTTLWNNGMKEKYLRKWSS